MGGRPAEEEDEGCKVTSGLASGPRPPRRRAGSGAQPARPAPFRSLITMRSGEGGTPDAAERPSGRGGPGRVTAVISHAHCEPRLRASPPPLPPLLDASAQQSAMFSRNHLTHDT